MPPDDSTGDRVAGRPFQLVIADDHEATRAGLRLALRPRGFTVAEEASDAEGAIEAVVRARPDMCLVATHLPGGGVRAAAEIHGRTPDVAIVMLAAAADDSELFAALDAGAVGYLLKDIDRDALCAALRGVGRGEAAIARSVVAGLIAEFRARRSAGAAEARLAPLTARQLRVLELLSSGVGTVEIGRRLGISPTTVRRHVSSIVPRLGVRDRAAAIAAYRAIRGAPAGRSDSMPAGG
jgi:DNA-binding NarL/FixJ family response regulator